MSQHAQPPRFVWLRWSNVLKSRHQPVGRLAFARAPPDLQVSGIDQRQHGAADRF
jgi:hypothetical protein